MSVKVTLAKCGPSLRPVSVVRLIREYTTRDLDEAKQILDGLLEGNQHVIEFDSRHTASEFCLHARELGIVLDLSD